MKKLAGAVLHLALVSTCMTSAGPVGAQEATGRPDAAPSVASRPPIEPASGIDSKQARKTADRLLRKRIQAALARAKGLNASRIIVRVRDGEATLQGSVTDSQQADLAVDTARRASGGAVRNQLRINGQLL
ncbi:BON domain-containing protein [Burkholderia sp. BCC0044]|uniref:BON domain-containing protein n=1 Tax=Burkholderia sp. BCC0044 TaxID=2676295 RepID=UPI001FC8A9BC|nr:BON domain-containing protein [Burkholderia sp. BCC0044]